MPNLTAYKILFGTATLVLLIGQFSPESLVLATLAFILGISVHHS